MQAKVEFVKTIFNLNVDNFHVVKSIADELTKIDDFDDYEKWIKDNLNSLDNQYMNAYKKFVFLTRKYLKQKLELVNKDRLKKSKTFAKTLAAKVKLVAPQIEENGLVVKQVKLDGEEFFTDFELSQLDKLGGLSACLRFQKSVSGSDDLEDKLIALMFDLLITDIIEYKPQKKTENMVNKLLGEAIKKI